MESAPKHFDYLSRYGEQLEDILSTSNLAADISRWRSTGMDDPLAVTVGCQRLVELSLKSLLGEEIDPRISLLELIELAEDEGVITHAMALKCQEMRVKGNVGAHASVNVVDACMTLELLDDYLRWLVSENFDDKAFSAAINGYSDDVFKVVDEEASDSLMRRARMAASLSQDLSIEREVSNLRQKAVSKNSEMLDVINELIKVRDRTALVAQQYVSSGSRENDEDQDQILSIAEEIYQQSDVIIDGLSSQAKDIVAEFNQVSDKVDQILGEHDYVKALLGNGSVATLDQLDVLAFPRTRSGVKTNILKLKGEAGSGKTLCLLAKLLREVDGAQEQLPVVTEKRALFVCFNKPLRERIELLLQECSSEFPHARDRIDVFGFDQIIRNLSVPESLADKRLRQFAYDARYPSGWNIRYESFGVNGNSTFLREAMTTVADRHPDRKNEYYLNESDLDNVVWVSDEIKWLECRYDDPDCADEYVQGASRTGRGTSHRPSTTQRQIIIEVWHEYRVILNLKKSFILEQALKRLLKSKELPQYDAIAIDEAQDLSLLSVRLLFKMKKDNPGALLYIAGDEGQKIYQRDFTWRELDGNATGYTITLKENKRNSIYIARFANRLQGGEPFPNTEKSGVFVGRYSNDVLRSVILKCQEAGESVEIIGGRSGYDLTKGTDSSLVGYMNGLKPKGLEFDNVIVDYDRMAHDTMEEEKRLRYVHFTRPRKRLYVRIPAEAPELMREYYPDYL